MNLEKTTFLGIVQDRKLQVAKRKEMELFISLFPEETELHITISKSKKERSSNQNSYYWGVIIAILANEFGYTSNEMHEALKWQFLRREEIGKPTTIKSTIGLSTTEFEDYAQQIRTWAQEEYNVFIPLPNEPPL